VILPDVAELVALRGAVQGLNLHAHRPALAPLHGGHRSAQRGRGLEFEEVRLYAPGDDARTIDWRVTARRGRVHTKLFREERERPVWLIADLHAGLFFGSKRQLKSALLLRAAAVLAWAASLGGDRLGAVIASGGREPRIIAPRARQAGVLPMLEALVEEQPRAPGVTDTKSLDSALTALRPLLQPGSLVLVLSDFAAISAETETLFATLCARSELRLLWLTDALEANGLPAGAYRVGLPGRLWWLDGQRSRAAWQRSWAERERQLGALAERFNLPLNRIDTSHDVAESLPILLREPSWAA
jgi:uncharacterized protein (DUF58 family)